MKAKKQSGLAGVGDKTNQPKACPLCKGEAVDRGHGVECRVCGLWLGDSTMAMRLGGYLKVWNTRPIPEECPGGD